MFFFKTITRAFSRMLVGSFLTIHNGCVQLFRRVTHGVKNITQMRSEFVFARRTERSAFLGATYQGDNS